MNSYQLQQALSEARIAVGARRQSLREAWHRWRQSKKIRLSARPAIQALRQLRQQQPSQSPLAGILLAEHLGDVVACEPVIRHLRETRPDARLVWLTNPSYASLVESHPLLHAVVPLHSVSEADVIARSGALDLAWDLHITGKPCARFQCNYTKSTGDPTITASNYYCFGPLLPALCRGAGLPALDGQPNLHIAPAARKKVDSLRLPARFVAIHGTSNETIRNWDPEKWRTLASKIWRVFGLPVVELGLRPIVSSGTEGCVDLCGKVMPIEMAEVIRRASVFIGIDSGPAHCANALQIPSVILLARYKNFGHYMPYTGYLRRNAREMLLRATHSLSSLPVESVLFRLRRVLATQNGLSGPVRRPVT
ncbi:hypothetical protein DB347_24775 [Opitutaceae bacterium EW11]|nr:hypothetical protein DB347_24775 [Opitutaceae bacterium EW11]